MEMETSSPAKQSSEQRQLLQVPSLPDHPDLFDKLATEVIEKIFISACPYVEVPGVQLRSGKTCSPISSDTMDPTVLSMVCRRWRDITTTYHFLWANIVIDPSEISLDEWYKRDCDLLLDDYLMRSGALPLQIRIEDHEGPGRISMLSGILSLVRLHCERWQSIAFDFPFSRKLLPEFDGLEGRLPLLEHLQIHPVWHDRLKHTLFLSAPLLRRLILKAHAFKFGHLLQIPWLKLSEATFHGILLEPEEFGEVMMSLSGSIKTLTFSSCQRSAPWIAITLVSSSWVPIPKKPVTLPTLQELYCWNSYDDILARLICPFLEKLGIERGTETEITGFLKMSSCSLTDLHLGHIRGGSRGVDSIADFQILQNSCLSTLKLLSLAGLADQVLNLLNLDSFHWLPSLETLHADVNSEYSDDPNVLSFMDSRIEHLRDIVESRTQAKIAAHHHWHLHPHPHGTSIGTHPHGVAHSHHIASHHVAHLHHIPHPHHIHPLYHPTHLHQPVLLHPHRDDHEISSLKHCHFGFQVEDKWRTDAWYSTLEDLRSFCLSRNVDVSLDTFTTRPPKGLL